MDVSGRRIRAAAAMVRCLVLTLVVGLVVPAAPVVESKILCIEVTDAEALNASDAVVSGQVTAILHDRFPSNIVGFTMGSTLIDVTVDRVWKGEASEHMRILQMFSDGLRITLNENYVFFLNSRPQRNDLLPADYRPDVRFVLNDCLSRHRTASHELGEGRPVNSIGR